MNYFDNLLSTEIGVNFWGSKNGIMMWREWDEESLKNDVALLSENGIKLLRVFPDWSFFQPIEEVIGYQGRTVGLSTDGGKTLIGNGNCFDGINETAMQRFAAFLDICKNAGVKVIPSILTGWMSGRLFVPPFLTDKNLITDPAAIKWELRFIRAFVTRFKGYGNIVAWCIGNECNCMSKSNNEESAWTWTAAVTDAIKALDGRPVISGMHSLLSDGEGDWTVSGQGENCDILTTHPYASPSYNTAAEPIGEIRPVMHPAAQSLVYEGLGKKQCIIEETGTFGEMYADEKMTAAYVKASLFNAWACGIKSYLWWIAFDQGDLSYHPFLTNNRGSNYGIFRKDGSKKPLFDSMNEFRRFADKVGTLPKRKTDGICLIPRGQRSWPCAFNSYILAKQNGLELDFAFLDDAVQKSPLYIIPSLASPESVRYDRLNEIMENVSEGSVLYVSSGSGLLRNFCRDFGIHIKSRVVFSCGKNITFDDGVKFPVEGRVEYVCDVCGGEVLARDENGEPVYVSAAYGKGRVFWFMRPIEDELYNVSDPFGKTAYPYRKVYSYLKNALTIDRALTSDDPYISITEHPVSENERIYIAVNCSAEDRAATFKIVNEWTVTETVSENGTDVIKADSAVMLRCKRKNNTDIADHRHTF